jgi:GntR family transcriptional regulator
MNKNYTPKYAQIQESLISWVKSGDLYPGDMIPSERELSEMFNVSRMTVRQAVSNLVSDGVLNRVQGVGTFITEQKTEYDIGTLVSFTESALLSGVKPSGKMIEFGQIVANERLARILKVNLGQKLYRLVRVRYGNNEPMVLEHCHFPSAIFPGIENYDLENQSTYHIWREEYGIVFGKMRQTLEPVMANEFEAKILDVPVGFLMMLVERVSYDVTGRPIEYAKDIHRGDKSRFVAELNIKLDG